MAGIVEDPEYSVPITGTLAALNQTVEFDSNGKGLQGVTVLGTWVGTILFEATIDSVNWFPVEAANQATNQSANFTTANGVFIVVTAGYTTSRVRMNPYTSGTANIADLGDNAVSTVYAFQSGTWTVQQGTPPWADNLTQVGGSAIALGQTTMSASLPVVIASNQSAINVAQSGIWTTGRTWALASGTDSVSVIQSTSPWVVSGTVTSTQGTTPWTIQGDSASGSAKAGNPVQIGGVFNTTQPTVTTGQTVEAQMTARGAQIVSTGVDAFNITNITGTVSLPTGAATSALQTTGNTSLATIATTLTRAIGSTTSGQTGNLIMGAVTTTAPTYTTAQTDPLSLTTAGALRVDGSGVTQPISGTVAVTQSTSPWITKDQSDGPVSPGTAASFSQLVGGVYNSSPSFLTTGQQSALQIDSQGRLIISPLGLLSEDHNYGAVGANTLRTASQIGNATGAADFNIGPVGAQTLRNYSIIGTSTNAADYGLANYSSSTLRVVLAANQPSIAVTATQGTSPWVGSDLADGPVTPGTAATKSMLGGGQYNSTLPTLTTGQQSALQLDANGRLIVDVGSGSISIGQIDNTTFTVGTSLQTPVGGTFNDGAPALLSQASAAFRMTSYRGLHVNLRDSSGNEKLAQQVMAASIPVVLASDQSAIPVSQSGTWTVQPGNTQNTTPWLVQESTPLGSVLNIFGYVSAVAASTLTTIATYTVPSLKKAYLVRAVFSGENISQYQLIKNGSTIDNQWTNFGGNMGGTFEFSTQNFGLPLVAGDVITLKTIHARPYVADFNGRIYYIEMTA